MMLEALGDACPDNLEELPKAMKYAREDQKALLLTDRRQMKHDSFLWISCIYDS
jgi:TusA-related sulfurtransferase